MMLRDNTGWGSAQLVRLLNVKIGVWSPELLKPDAVEHTQISETPSQEHGRKPNLVTG